MEKKNNRKQVNIINVLTDALLLVISYVFAMFLRFKVLGGAVTVSPIQTKFIVVVLLLSVITAASYQLYRKSYLTIAVANAIETFVIMALFFVFRIFDFSRLSLVIFWLVSTVLIICKHFLGHKILKSFYGNHKKILVGTGKSSDLFISEYPETIDRIKPEELENTLKEREIDEIIIALDPEDAEKVPGILQIADKDGLYVSMVPFFSEYIPANPEIESIGKTKLIDLRATPLDNLIGATIKRVGDILGSLLLIIVTSPIMLVTAIGVKLSSPGPIFFKQERVGKDKKTFKMLKFRSMRVNAEENTGWSKEKDPRRTAFGSFIRKYSIDELPQFFNVLIGDMSLVGPRPEIPFFVHQFRETIPLYLVRQQVRPGITGWAQVNGLRGDTSIETRVEYDIWYIENWSVLLDIKILFMTVFGGKFKNDEK